MSSFDDIGLAMIPSGYKEDKLYSVLPNDGNGDFDFSRSSSATRVNSEGLIETVQILGSELVTNGTFDTDSNWNKGTGWSISGGKAIATSAPSGARLEQFNLGQTVGRPYKITLTISDLTEGGFGVFLGGVSQTGLSTNGTHTIYLTPTGTSQLFIFTSGTTTGSIDNVSVKEVIENDVPRLDYSGGASCPALLLEPQRTNLLPYSEDFTQWTPSRANSTFGAVSPSGELNATTITDDGSGGSSGVVRIQAANFNIIASTKYTFSAYVKANPNDQIVVATRNDDALRGGTFNISTLTFTPQQGTETGEVQSFGNGYYRIITNWTSGTDTSIAIGIGFPTIVVDGTNSFILWGAQVEQGSYATSYIPTNGTSVTRNADVCNNAGTSSTFNDSEGVLFAEIRALDSSNIFDFGLYGNTSTNQVRIGFFNNDVYASLYNGSYQTQMSAPNDLSDFTKIAFKYKENDFALWVNGVEVATDSSGTTFNSGDLVKLNLSAQNGTSSLVLGKTKQLIVFDEALSDEELSDLTGQINTTFNSLATFYGYTILS